MENEKETKNENRETENGTEKKKITSRQIVAMGGVILLVLMYVATLVVAIVDSSASMHWFAACLFATVFLPFLIWIYTWLYKKITGKED